MWNVSRFIFATICLSSFPAFAAGPASPAKEAAGEVVSVDGIAFVRADGREGNKNLKPAKPGDSVYAGDVINTSSNGKVKVLMKDKSIVDVGPSALLKLDHFAKKAGADREVDVTMMYGTLRAAVTQKLQGSGRFKVKTPMATMGVRGTEFVVKSDVSNMEQIKHAITNPGSPMQLSSDTKKGDPSAPPAPKTEITVLQGEVAVKKNDVPKPVAGARIPAAAQEVSLTAGKQITAEAGVKEMPKAVTLDQKQLAAVSKEVKIADNTFHNAISVDVGGGNSSGSAGGNPTGGGTGNSTLEAMNSVVSIDMASAPPIRASDMGVAGTFTVTQTFNQIPTQQNSGSRRLRVFVVERK